MGVAEMKRLSALAEENRKLKQLVADLSLDKQMLQEILRKNLKPTQLREHAEILEVCYGMSERRACRVLQLQWPTCQSRSVADEQAILRIRLRDMVQATVSYGYRRLHILLRRKR